MTPGRRHGRRRSLNQIFLNVYDGGQAYTESQHRDWLTEAGFGDFKHEVQANGTSIVSVRKRA